MDGRWWRSPASLVSSVELAGRATAITSYFRIRIDAGTDGYRPIAINVSRSKTCSLSLNFRIRAVASPMIVSG